MNIRISGLVICFFALAAVIYTIKKFKQDRLSLPLMFFWSGAWFAIGFFALFPNLLDYLMRFVNMGNRMFFLNVTAILILFAIIFYLTTVISRMNRKLVNMVREIALLRFKLEQGSGVNRAGEPGDNSAEGDDGNR